MVTNMEEQNSKTNNLYKIHNNLIIFLNLALGVSSQLAGVAV